MLSTNVLCIKKKKKRNYCIIKRTENEATSAERSKRSSGGAMLQVTEDTPPDMLAGAMDLTVHLPTGRSVKMSVERSTPMMDLLVQISTNYHLQLSGYTLQVLGMAPTCDHSDTILPYKPNTPIGALDTQHIKVLPKPKNISTYKPAPSGQLPFESTFRLKVHLPRNQLYVTRVNQNVHLEYILKKVCDEKCLDSSKYEFRHPGNLDELLDLKLTLSDYAITEIYLVQKGSLNHTFSTGDIMSVRKEEERRQMHSKTGGGVFNLIFRRGKSSTGSLSSENRSISPTHSEDSRSVTPPAVQQPAMTSPEADKPKPPQRKRRPAPKPPTEKKTDQNLTICHSRNSSDSSGYHEASILSDNNTTLPRRPKSMMITGETQGTLSQKLSQSTSNLSKLAATQSKSMSGLAFPSRKKKTAPPPPPQVSKLETTQTNLEEPSPVVASQPCIVVEREAHGNGQENVVDNNTNPKPKPRTRTKSARPPRPCSLVSITSEHDNVPLEGVGVNVTQIESQQVAETKKSSNSYNQKEKNETNEEKKNTPQIQLEKEPDKKIKSEPDSENVNRKAFRLAELQKESLHSIFDTPAFKTKPEVVALHPKPINKEYNKFDSYTRKRGFQIGTSLLEDDRNSENSIELSNSNSVSSALNAFDFVDEIGGDLDVELFTGSLSGKSKKTNVILNQLHGIHELENSTEKSSGGSLRSVHSFPGFVGTNMKKWNNFEELDDISLMSCDGRSGWVIGDTSDTESIASTQPFGSSASTQSLPSTVIEEKSEGIKSRSTEIKKNGIVSPIEQHCENNEKDIGKETELESEWQYQLPSPPRDFRDSSPVREESTVDSVVTCPELFEKLKVIKDNRSETVSDTISVVSEEEKPILNKLSFENLEKRKSLVYNRELATSLKMHDESIHKDTLSSSLINFEKTYEEVKRSSPKEVITTSTLPNFKITTYNNPKQKIDIFEDDTIRSGNKKHAVTETSFSLGENSTGRSAENITCKNGGLESNKFTRKPQANINRSESLSRQWIPLRPVKRSQSQVVLPKCRDTKNVSQQIEEDDGLTIKSSSLFDVSGLSSLGVLRSIQNKLNTPNTSTERVDKEEPNHQEQPEIESTVQKPPIRKVYKYKPPSINMSTWSERPKVAVNVKEDPDYKFGPKGTNSSKSTINTDNRIRNHNTMTENNETTNYTNGVIVKIGSNCDGKNSNKVDVSSETGNVVIKIEDTNSVNNKPVFRKLGNGNVEHQRPHSIALSSDFDIDRVPVVRSVEFKKSYNTSVTQIYQNNNTTTTTWKNEIKSKPVTRVNSHLQNYSGPIVRGFRNSSNEMWNQNSSTSSSKPRNNSTSFSSTNLRLTEFVGKKNIPPVVPILEKNSRNQKNDVHKGDPKEQLLQAIRDFGGKKGLRTVKV